MSCTHFLEHERTCTNSFQEKLCDWTAIQIELTVDVLAQMAELLFPRGDEN